MKISKDKFYLLVAIYFYQAALAASATLYLPFQIYAPGVFKSYHFNGFALVYFLMVAILAIKLTPISFDRPSAWYKFILNYFLFCPGMVLGYGTTVVDKSEKALLLVSIVLVFFIFNFFVNFGFRGKVIDTPKFEDSRILFFLLSAWLVLLLILLVKYGGVMRFSALDSIYDQRELTNDVGGFWGYVQLYFSRVFSTLMIGWGLVFRRQRYFLIGAGGYFVTYLITAEKSALIYPIFLFLVYVVARGNKNPIDVARKMLFLFSSIILLVSLFYHESQVLDLVGFFLLTRVLATPSQFIFDYYKFFSEAGYTFFSHVRVFDLFITPPSYAIGSPKWPQLGWIVAENIHGITSNSNATFLASDGVASFGIFGMLIMVILLSIYLRMVDNLSWKMPAAFTSIVFSQQAFTLVSASFFSVFLSFGGGLLLIFLLLYRPNTKMIRE